MTDKQLIAEWNDLQHITPTKAKASPATGGDHAVVRETSNEAQHGLCADSR